MGSRAEVWRRRIRRGQTSIPQAGDPKARLLQRVVGEPTDEFHAWLAAPLSAAAVLVGLLERANGPSVLLTKRASHLPQHPGQIAFPGGRVAAGETVTQAAFREAEEEVGLRPGQAQLLAELPAQMTGTGYCVTPVLALLAQDFEPVPDPSEVAAVFEFPLAHMHAAGTRRQVAHERLGTRFLSEEFTYRDHRIWGATATILIDCLEVISEKTE